MSMDGISHAVSATGKDKSPTDSASGACVPGCALWSCQRQRHARDAAAFGAVAERDLAAVGAGDGAGDAEAQAGAAALRDAAADEPLEHAIVRVGRAPGDCV